MPATWRTDWTVQSPPTLASDQYATLSEQAPYATDFAGDGDLLMSTLSWSGGGTELFRLSANGGMRWSAALTLSEGYEVGPVFAASDGGAYVASERLEAVSRIDALGNLIWTRRVPTQWFAEASASSLIVASCEGLASLQKESGVVNWQRALSFPQARCAMSGFEAAADTSFYASVQIDAYSAADSTRVLKYGLNGVLAWQVDLPNPDARLLGVDARRVYLATSTQLSALDAESGKLLWQSTPQVADFFLVQTLPARPVAVAVGSVVGYSPATGEADWSTPITRSGHVDAVGDSVLAQTQAGLVRIDAANGDLLWTSALPKATKPGFPVDRWLRFGGLDNDRFMAVAKVNAPASQPAPLLQSIDFSTGRLIERLEVANTTQGVSAQMILDADHIYSIVTEQDPDSTRYRLRSINASNGLENWSSTYPLFDPPVASDRYRAGTGSISASHGRVAAVLAELKDSNESIAISTWDSATGLPLWLNVLRPANEVWPGTAISSPLIDADRNVLVSLATYVECGYPDSCASYQLRKLAASNGAELWRHEFNIVTQMEPPYLGVREFTVLGTSVILDGGNYELLRLDGNTGAVEWSVDTGDLGDILWMQITSEGDILVNGFLRWGKLDGANGTLLWSGPSPSLTCQPTRCTNPTTLVLPDGDLLQVGSRSTGNGPTEPMVALLHTDGTGTYERWFPLQGSVGSSRISSVEVDSLGQVWMQLREGISGSRFAARWLTRFDVDSGRFVGRQALGINPANVLGHVDSPFLWLDSPENNRLLAGTFVRDTPSAQTMGVGLFDTTILANGNVSVAATVSDGAFMPGQIMPFSTTVTYEGDLDIHEVELRVSLPWGGALSALSCSSGAESSCAIHIEDGDLRARFNLQPGAAVVIHGEVQVLESDDPAPALSAVVQGPTNLLESDSTDNIALVRTKQAIFNDGFDNNNASQRGQVHLSK